MRLRLETDKRLLTLEAEFQNAPRTEPEFGCDAEIASADAINAVGLLLQLVGELAFVAGRMLSDREYYAGPR